MATTKTELVEIKPIEMKTVEIEIIGDTPLIMHAWSEKAKRMMLERARNELRAFKAKYNTLKELKPVFDAIEEV